MWRRASSASSASTSRPSGTNPDGRNINLDCGSTHPERLAAVVVERGLAFGVAFDGDGDRAIFIDERGRVVDGDAVLLICGQQLKAEGRLAGNTVVATVMSNIGLELALRAQDISLVRCQVGDRYVKDEMVRRGFTLGGEQSGHVIFSDYLFTGDGLGTALQMVRVMLATGRPLGELAAQLTTYPQVLVNVRVRERVELATVPAVAAAIRNRRGSAGGTGTTAGQVLGDRAVAAHHARGTARGRDSGVGRRDRRGREDAPRLSG